MFQDVGDKKDGSIHGWHWIVWFWWYIFGWVSEVVVASYSGTCLGFRDVGGVTVDGKNHIGSMVVDDGIWVGCTIV